MASIPRRKSSNHSHTSRRRSSASTRQYKTEIRINVYDLLPPGKLSTTLWHLGSPLLHTGLVITSLNREYAFGGHSHPNLTGIYYIPPGTEDPSLVTFRLSYLCGYSHLPPKELEALVAQMGKEYMGTDYNLLTNNCNHFSSALCERLTGRRAPGWMNRAAHIGVCLPCVVPREWTGSASADDDDDSQDGREEERKALLKGKGANMAEGMKDKVLGSQDIGRARRKSEVGIVRDEEGRVLPTSERTPLLGLVGRGGDGDGMG